MMVIKSSGKITTLTVLLGLESERGCFRYKSRSLGWLIVVADTLFHALHAPSATPLANQAIFHGLFWLP